MKVKVLLVYPWFPDTYWSFRHALQFDGKMSAFPPLGLCTISAMLPETWERKLVDMNVTELKREDVANADLVMTSAMLVQKDSLKEVIGLCNELGVPVAVGGPFVTTTHEELVGANFVFRGEAEETIGLFVRDFEQGVAKPIYQAANRPSIEMTPPPDLKLLDLSKYSAMPVQYSRGCPFNCEFCDIIEIYGRVPRTKTNEQMLAELDALKAIGWRGTVFIVDDNFIGNKPRVKKFLPDLIAWQERNNRPFVFLTEASVNLAEDEELLELMWRAGFNKVFLGIETPVEASLKEAQKGQNLRRNLLDSVRRIQAYGMEVMAGFIVGFDNDPEDIFQRMVGFIRDSAIPFSMVGTLEALPDTQLWRRLEKEGRLRGESKGNNTHSVVRLNFDPIMNEQKLIAGYHWILERVYNPREYYDRALESLRRVSVRRAIPGQKGTSFAHDLKSFYRVVSVLGFSDKQRFEFWRYFAKSVIRPRSFIRSMYLAAMGYHFRVLTEKYQQLQLAGN